jgi:phosphoesterase RecJ-like protein
MQVAAELLERGVQAQEIGGHLYDNYSPERLKLLEMILSTMTLSASDTIAFIHVSQKMFKESGATLQDVEGFIDFPRSIRTVRVAAFVKESKPGIVAVSLRAKGDCDVAGIAKEFEGGGHRSAAGFRCLDKTIAEVRREVEEKIRMALK